MRLQPSLFAAGLKCPSNPEPCKSFHDIKQVLDFYFPHMYANTMLNFTIFWRQYIINFHIGIRLSLIKEQELKTFNKISSFHYTMVVRSTCRLWLVKKLFLRASYAGPKIIPVLSLPK